MRTILVPDAHQKNENRLRKQKNKGKKSDKERKNKAKGWENKGNKGKFTNRTISKISKLVNF